MKNIANTTNGNVQCIHVIPTVNAKELETAIHIFWMDKRIKRSEWFMLTDDDVLLFCEQTDGSLFLSAMADDSNQMIT